MECGLFVHTQPPRSLVIICTHTHAHASQCDLVLTGNLYVDLSQIPLHMNMVVDILSATGFLYINHFALQIKSLLWNISHSHKLSLLFSSRSQQTTVFKGKATFQIGFVHKMNMTTYRLVLAIFEVLQVEVKRKLQCLFSGVTVDDHY